MKSAELGFAAELKVGCRRARQNLGGTFLQGRGAQDSQFQHLRNLRPPVKQRSGSTQIATDSRPILL
jgi:hypothetical protein